MKKSYTKPIMEVIETEPQRFLVETSWATDTYDPIIKEENPDDTHGSDYGDFKGAKKQTLWESDWDY